MSETTYRVELKTLIEHGLMVPDPQKPRKFKMRSECGFTPRASADGMTLDYVENPTSGSEMCVIKDMIPDPERKGWLICKTVTFTAE